MNQQQRKHLMERLVRATREQRDVKDKSVAPKEVLAAKKLVRAWESIQHRKHSKERAKVYARVDARAAKVREILLFGDADKALAAVKAFERGA